MIKSGGYERRKGHSPRLYSFLEDFQVGRNNFEPGQGGIGSSIDRIKLSSNLSYPGELQSSISPFIGNEREIDEMAAVARYRGYRLLARNINPCVTDE